MQNTGPSELYPIGTDILRLYIGVDSNDQLLLTPNTTIQNGEIVSGNTATSDIYIPVSTDYVYRKGARRMAIWYYDSNKAFLGKSDNSTWLPEEKTLSAFPTDTAFIRCQFLNGPNVNWKVDITRIA